MYRSLIIAGILVGLISSALAANLWFRHKKNLDRYHEIADVIDEYSVDAINNKYEHVRATCSGSQQLYMIPETPYVLRCEANAFSEVMNMNPDTLHLLSFILYRSRNDGENFKNPFAIISFNYDTEIKKHVRVSWF